MAENFDAERRELQARLDAERAHLHHLAVHDPLTGLPNRTLLLDPLTHALAMTDRRQRPVTVLFLDLDDFKAINDDFGHSEGDNLLVAMASRLTSWCAPPTPLRGSAAMNSSFGAKTSTAARRKSTH